MEPRLIERARGLGWLAVGQGWAVDGPTREDAVRRFHEAEDRHRRIDAQPYWYERLRDDAHRQVVVAADELRGAEDGADRNANQRADVRLVNDGSRRLRVPT